MRDSETSAAGRAADRLRRGALWLIFALVLLIPKLNRLRRRPRLWNFVRVLTVFAGAAILVLGGARGYYVSAVVLSALMLLFALLAAPERPASSIDARARELGALIVVDGGLCVDAAGVRRRAKLFVASDGVFVLNLNLQVLLELPLYEIRTVMVEQAGANWRLRMDCGQAKADFIYEGSFAEHLARVAEATVRSRLQRELPILP
jgi:hypothetical protein